MWQKNPCAQERARAKRKGSYPTKKQQEFSTTPIYIYIYTVYISFRFQRALMQLTSK